MGEPNKKNKLKIPLDLESDKNLIEEGFTIPKEKDEQPTEPVKAKKRVKMKEGLAIVEKGESAMQSLQAMVSFLRGEKPGRVFGLILIFCATYLGVACISYFMCWQADQDKVLGPVSVLFSPETHVQNWFGKLGALISHLFMYRWFGISTLVLVPFLLLRGVSGLLHRASFFSPKWWVLAVLGMSWISMILAYFIGESAFLPGGGLGYVINSTMLGWVGPAGTLSLILLIAASAVVIIFDFGKKEKALLDEKPQAAATEESENKMEEKESEVFFGNKLKIPLQNELPNESEVEKSVAMELSIEENLKEEMTVVSDKQEEDEGDLNLEIEEVPEEKVGNSSESLVEKFGEYDPTLDLSEYRMPSLDLLENYGDIETRITQEELNGNKDRIIATLRNYGIEIEKIKATIGPTVTLYEIVPAAGIRISKIKNLEDDIALSLAALGIRIIAPIPGRGTIGIEVPNQNPEMVPMRNILATEKFQNSGFDLPIALGKTISNETYIADLAKMPHLLMAGATGQGKSVGLNCVLVSLLYKKHPSQIKFVLVDPKKVELTLYNKIERYFLAKLPNSEDAIITDNTKVIHTLNSLCIEMDNRYALLQEAQVRNIKEYNVKFKLRKLNPNEGHKFLPYIVLVIDEFADLIMTAGKEVEMPIARIAQLARAVGIHLIIATQRPSVNIITGVIKANFPARIAFRVSSKIDSRTILDSGGADQLIGRGDMLMSTGNDLIRIQCAFVDTPEIERITEFIGSQRGYPSAYLLPEYIDENAEGVDEIDLSERDKMFDEAARVVVQHQQGSASLIQRKLKLGYNRAGRIIDQLEAAGIVGSFEGSKAREVLMKDLSSLEGKLKDLNQGKAA